MHTGKKDLEFNIFMKDLLSDVEDSLTTNHNK